MQNIPPILKFKDTGNMNIINPYRYGIEAALPPPGYKAWYKFDGNTNDETGSYNAVSSLNVTYVSDRNSNPNSAASFAGNGEVVLPSSFKLAGQSAATIACWFNLSTLSVNNYLIADGLSGLTTPSHRLYVPSSNIPNGLIRTTAGLYSRSGNVVSTGVWYHFMLVWTGSFLTLYMDNVQVGAPLAAGGTIVDDLRDTYFGRHPGGVDYLNGILDSAIFYTFALDSGQRTQLFEAD